MYQNLIIMILVAAIAILFAMLVMMAGFYFLQFVRKENLGKSHVILSYVVIVFSMLVIAGTLVGGIVKAAVHHCGKASCQYEKSYSKYHGHGNDNGCPMMMHGSCGNSSSCMKMTGKSGGSCQMNGGDCGSHCSMMSGSGCKMNGKTCSGKSKCAGAEEKEMVIEVEKTITIDDNGKKTTTTEVKK